MAVIVKKWGNCLAVRLPKALADSCRITEGVSVEPEKTPQGLLLRPVRRRKHTLKSMLSKMKGRNPYGEADIGGPVGREIL
jgi:antitoxin component of MazEF toxin-antitoxin module